MYVTLNVDAILCIFIEWSETCENLQAEFTVRKAKKNMDVKPRYKNADKKPHKTKNLPLIKAKNQKAGTSAGSKPRKLITLEELERRVAMLQAKGSVNGRPWYDVPSLQPMVKVSINVYSFK